MEEAQAPEEVVETTEEVATLEVEETTEAETLEEDTPEASTEEAPVLTNSDAAKKRIKYKAQRDRADNAEKELQHLKEQMYRNQQAQQPAQPTTPTAQRRDPNAPLLDQFDDVEDYMDARDTYRDNARDQQQKSNSQVSKFNELEAEYARNNATYQDDIAYGHQIPPAAHVAQEILNSPLGPQLLQAYSKDSALAQKLNRMNTSEAIREIVKLEEKVKLTPAVSSAPAPISTSKTSMPTGSKKYSEGQSQRDYATQREAYIASKRR